MNEYSIFRDRTDPIWTDGTHFTVIYSIESTISIEKAAWDLAIGQSIGNPNVRNSWETDVLFNDHACKVAIIDPFGLIAVAFPVVNIDWTTDGVSQLLCMIMGGQVDIDHIVKCRAEDIQLPHSWSLSPKIGLTGFRELTGSHNRPFLGGIVKPKTGLRPHELLDLVKELVDGGCDFIKEDEILSNPAFCKLEDRLPNIMNYLDGKNVIYAPCINSDPAHILDRVKLISKLGGNGVHANIWSGLGVYKSIRELDLPLFIHYQKSGDRVITDPANRFSINWTLLLTLASACGVDMIHTGMWGGYLNDDPHALATWMHDLRLNNVIPALSCGMSPYNVGMIANRFGADFCANTGGALHGHSGGTYEGTRAMREAIDGWIAPTDFE